MKLSEVKLSEVMLVVDDTPDGTHEMMKRYLNFHKHCSNIFW